MILVTLTSALHLSPKEVTPGKAFSVFFDRYVARESSLLQVVHLPVQPLD
jgi:hypothetical protein